MASPKSPALLLLLLASVLALASGQQQQEYCRDTLGGLEACHAFMYEGAARASAGCCAAYSAAFDADPFCLCYIANGVYGRSTGYNVNVTHALEIPTSCGQIAPPIDLCNSKFNLTQYSNLISLVWSCAYSIGYIESMGSVWCL